jgi:hypothetical protein
LRGAGGRLDLPGAPLQGRLPCGRSAGLAALKDLRNGFRPPVDLNTSATYFPVAGGLKVLRPGLGLGEGAAVGLSGGVPRGFSEVCWR